MLIRDVKFYIQPDGSRRRSASNGGMGTIEKVPPGLSGLFTHSGGFRDGSIRIDEGLIDPGALCLQYAAAGGSPHFKSTIRLVTDGGYDAYAGFGSGFHADDLEWAAKEFKVRLAPMLLGVDAFDREFIWQRLWYAQRVLLHRPRRRRHGRPHALEPGEPLRLHAVSTSCWGHRGERHPGVPQHRRGHHRRTGRQRPQGQGGRFRRLQGSLLPRGQGEYRARDRAAPGPRGRLHPAARPGGILHLHGGDPDRAPAREAQLHLDQRSPCRTTTSWG